MKRLHNAVGMFAATFTPLHDDGEINLGAIAPMCDFLVSQGVSGLYVLGSTGEGYSLTVDERIAVAKAFIAATNRRIPVIVQVGCECLWDARRLAAAAQADGADAVSAVCPVYFKSESVSNLVDAMALIASGAPALPFYYYHIPMVTGSIGSALDFLTCAATKIPTLGGMKYTAKCLADFQACVEFAEHRFDLFWGVDEMLLGGLVGGAKAAVGSTYNFSMPIYRELWSAFERGDMNAAQRFQSEAQAIVRAFLPHGPRASQKAIMNLIGVDCGPARLPLQTVSGEKLRRLHRDLQSTSMRQWIIATLES